MDPFFLLKSIASEVARAEFTINPGAFWLLLGSGVDLRSTSYASEDAAARIRETSYPQAMKLSRDILHPRSEDETLELFSKVELT